MAREPGYCLHKPTRQAYVNLGGKVIYLGKHGTDASKTQYERVKAEWLVNRHSPAYTPQSSGPTVAEICLAFLDYAEEYYAKSTEGYHFELAIKPLSELYATLPARDFGVVEFRTVRNWWLTNPIDRSKVRTAPKAKPARPWKKKPVTSKPPQFRSRQHINKLMKRLVRVFRWAVGEGMVPPTVPETLKCVDPIKRGRTSAHEAKPIKPVTAELVEETLPYLTPVLRDMVQVQQLVGCRPGELVSITPAMVDRTHACRCS